MRAREAPPGRAAAGNDELLGRPSEPVAQPGLRPIVRRHLGPGLGPWCTAPAGVMITKRTGDRNLREIWAGSPLNIRLTIGGQIRYVRYMRTIVQPLNIPTTPETGRK